MTHSHRRRAAIALTALVTAPLALVTTTSATATADNVPLASSVAVAWQRTAIRTVFAEAGLAPPAGALYLSFTSLAVHDAAVEGQRQGTHAAAAAVAQAAHDVLSTYFTAHTTTAKLDADLTASLAKVPDGKKQDAGVAIGAAAAAAMTASRVGDGRNDASVVYSKPLEAPFWQPAAGGGMALAWLGFVDPVVDVPPVALDGPDRITSPEYAVDYDEVRRVGALDSPITERSVEQTAIARFFSGNPVLAYRDALCRYLDSEPLGLLPTTRMFARIDAAQVTSFIATWRLKYDEGFWRPFQAIGATGQTWVPLIANPAYSDYTSGHAAATAPFAEVVRQTLGDDTPLVLRAGGVERPYATLSTLEHDALNARIWGGLHFRDAMDDGYYLGHTTAERVMRAIR